MKFSGNTLVLIALALLALAIKPSNAFVKGLSTTRARPVSSTELYAATKKKKAAKKKAAKKSDVKTLQKAELVAKVAKRMGSTKADADAAIAAVVDTITNNVCAGKKVMLPGFGSFQLRARAAQKGRNLQTGEAIDIKASNLPGFSASKVFKEKANE